MEGFIFSFTLGTYILLLIVVLSGQPPKHCQYMVPVKNHPGIYSCSQYPRAVSVKK